MAPAQAPVDFAEELFVFVHLVHRDESPKNTLGPVFGRRLKYVIVSQEDPVLMLARVLPTLLLCSFPSPAQIVFVPIEGQRAAAAENLFDRASTVPAMKCAFSRPLQF
jgi:hypothetical protein